MRQDVSSLAAKLKGTFLPKHSPSRFFTPFNPFKGSSEVKGVKKVKNPKNLRGANGIPFKIAYDRRCGW